MKLSLTNLLDFSSFNTSGSLLVNRRNNVLDKILRI